jgi:hypothetical protein
VTSADEHIRLAGQRVRAAADQWNAVDLSAVVNCVAVLESSVASLAAASEILRSSPEGRVGTLRAGLFELNWDVKRLQRLVSGSGAFLRGLPGAECADVEMYQPGGFALPIASGKETWGLQG